MLRNKKTKQMLRCYVRYQCRFSILELKIFHTLSKNAGLSQVEYARRRMLERPIAELVPTEPFTLPENPDDRIKRFIVRFEPKDLRECKRRVRESGLSEAEYARRKIFGLDMTPQPVTA